MKRWTLRICLFLLLGAIVNVAVAWGCIRIQPRIDPVLTYHNPTGEEPLVVTMTTRFGLAVVEQVEPSEMYLKHWPEDIRAIEGPIWWSTSMLFHTAARSYAMAAGWPMLSLMTWGNTLESNKRRHDVYWGLAGEGELTSNLMRSGPCPRVFPTCPIWPGFAINTVFYAAILRVMFAVPLALRRRRRIKRGLCPACAYPVGDSEVCTECGNPMKPKEMAA